MCSRDNTLLLVPLCHADYHPVVMHPAGRVAALHRIPDLPFGHLALTEIGLGKARAAASNPARAGRQGQIWGDTSVRPPYSPHRHPTKQGIPHIGAPTLWQSVTGAAIGCPY